MNAYALADFADGDGIFLGYETTQQGNDVVITNKVDLSDYGITDRVLKIRDPAKGSLTLKKEDAQTGEKLAGATFRVEYTLFRNWDEKESFTDETLAACNWITAANPTAATDANGTVTVAGLEPGIYKITEVTPPNGYKADPTPRYVVVTGGMRKTVTLNGKILAEIPETFRNYSLTAQTQTGRGNPGHTQAAGTAASADAASADAVIPQTGDASRPLVWVVLLALSGLALAGLTVCRKRKYQ